MWQNWHDPTEWQRRTDAALAWVVRSVEATGGFGSSHSFSPLRGWAPAYAETTGYLLPTLFHYAGRKNDPALRTLAFQSANWLLSRQLPSGAFPGLTGKHRDPSLFNTSQILFGLVKSAAEISTEDSEAAPIIRASDLHDALSRAARWMLDLLEKDGAWRQAAYVPGFVPSYYTRAVWGLMCANIRLDLPGLADRMRGALRYYAGRFLPNGAVRHWGFRPGKAAFTHTIAYTLEGFWESALLLDDSDILDRTLHSANVLLGIYRKHGRAAGRYDERWQGDYHFRCLTGQAQLSCFYHRLWQTTGEETYRLAASGFLKEILEFQSLGRNRNTYGALPGSAPLWGPYLRFRYPNWGVKFFLDALALCEPRLS